MTEIEIHNNIYYKINYFPQLNKKIKNYRITNENFLFNKEEANSLNKFIINFKFY